MEKKEDSVYSLPPVIIEKNNDKNKHTKTILHATMKVLLRKIMTKTSTQKQFCMLQ